MNPRSTTRNYTVMDRLCLGVDQALRAISGHPRTTAREYPAQNQPEAEMSASESKHAQGLMRINHAGEVAAQALYHGQGLASKNPNIKTKMQLSAIEEGDHLAWCSQRLTELGSHSSYLAPVWYAGSFMIGLTAGLVGDKWSLGFLAETEYQVIQHLKHHLKELPKADQKSAAVLKQMEIDEALHQQEAIDAGASELPGWIKRLMRMTSKIMVKTAYWI